MKTFVAINVFNFLSKLKLNKIEDRTTRNTLISNHLALYRFNKEYNEDVQELRTRVFGDKLAETQKYADTLKALESATDPDEIAKLKKEVDPEMDSLVSTFNEQYDALMNKEQDLNIKAAPYAGFVDAMVQNDIDFTMTDIIEFTELGLLEENE